MKSFTRICLLAIAIPAFTSACAPSAQESPLAACMNAQSAETALGRCAEVIDSPSASPHDRAVAYSYRAGWLQSGGRPAEALADANSAVQLAPNDAVALAGRGSIYVAQGQLEPGTRDLEAAIRLDPKNIVALGNRGVVHEKLGEWDKARAIVDRVLELDPDSAPGWEEKCWIGAASAPDAASALADCDKAIEIFDAPNNYNSRGLANYRAGKFADAIADYDHSIEGDPNVASSYFMRGLAKQAAGIDGAQADIDKGLQLEPGVRERYVRVGILAP